jgi:glycosyltransferase involved in cell wall biosynthesis
MTNLKKYPLISIIINCYNGEKYLNECIKCVLGQSYKNWEIVFLDNNSSDQSVQVINTYKDKRIKLFFNRNKSHLSLYKARNLAISHAKGEYITFLDVDDLWKKNKLKEQVNCSKKNPNIKIIYSNYSVLNEQKKLFYTQYKKKLPSGFIAQKLLDSYCTGVATLFIEKKLFKKYKFKDRYSIIGDFDLIIRLSIKYKIMSIQKPLSIYRVHGSNLSLRRIDLYIKELKYWLKNNNKILIKYKLNPMGVKYNLLKLRIKFIFNKFF